MQVSGQLHPSAALRLRKDSSTHWKEDCAGPKANLDAMAKIKSPFPDSGGNLTSIVQPAA